MFWKFVEIVEVWNQGCECGRERGSGMVPSLKTGESGTLLRYLHLRAEDLVSAVCLLSDIV